MTKYMEICIGKLKLNHHLDFLVLSNIRRTVIFSNTPTFKWFSSRYLVSVIQKMEGTNLIETYKICIAKIKNIDR